MNTTSVVRLIAAVSFFISPIAASAQANENASKTQASAPASASSDTKAEAPAEKKICKQLPSSNSRLPNRTCLTAEQWKQVEADSQ